MAAVGWFMFGLLAEIARLGLLLAAGLSATFFGGRMGPAPAGLMAVMLLVFAVYALIALVAARDVTQRCGGAGHGPTTAGPDRRSTETNRRPSTSAGSAAR